MRSVMFMRVNLRMERLMSIEAPKSVSVRPVDGRRLIVPLASRLCIGENHGRDARATLFAFEASVPTLALALALISTNTI